VALDRHAAMAILVSAGSAHATMPIVRRAQMPITGRARQQKRAPSTIVIVGSHALCRRRPRGSRASLVAPRVAHTREPTGSPSKLG
jgi:hypothetical protein